MDLLPIGEYLRSKSELCYSNIENTLYMYGL